MRVTAIDGTDLDMDNVKELFSLVTQSAIEQGKEKEQFKILLASLVAIMHTCMKEPRSFTTESLVPLVLESMDVLDNIQASMDNVVPIKPRGGVQ